MSIAESARRYLDSTGIRYRILSHPRTETLEQAAGSVGIPLQSLARALMLKDGKGLLMAVLPTSHVIDFAALCEILQRPVDLAPSDEVAGIFRDCEPGSFPPLAAAYGIDAIVDHSLTDSNDVYIEPGDHTSLIKVSSEDFEFLQRDYRRGSFARPIAALKHPRFPGTSILAIEQMAKRFTIQRRIEDIHDLPAMPPMAARILELHGDPLADADDLAEVIELDPGLAAQVIRYATSPFYGYRGKITSIADAISRVLGFDVVMSIALGLAMGRSFQIPFNGPLGLRAYWRHALYSALLTQKLSNMMPLESRPPVGLAYLTGLLHDFGHLIFAHVFQPEFFLLNRLVMANANIAIIDLERTVIGVQHEQIGAWLMRAWGMPEELVAVVRWHHHEHYHGEYVQYVQLSLLADILLKPLGIGDAASDALPPHILQALGLSEAQAKMVLSEVIARAEALDALARECCVEQPKG